MIKAIVTDIEGTTTSISFVADVLFPYATTHLEQFVLTHISEPQVRQLLEEASQIGELQNADTTAIIQQLLQWIDADKKVTPLKTLQGLIWTEGYNNGELKGHLYDDAYRHLRQWHEAGIRLYVYSSGSVQAQKLLFQHSIFGNIDSLFAGHFDTHIGHKREAESYRKILQSLALDGNEVLFLSDIKEELDAAKESGMLTIGIDRSISKSNLNDADANNHQWVNDFSKINLF